MGIYNSVPIETSVAPGETVDISVNLQAPNTPGTYTGNFILRDYRFNRFGTGLNSNNPIWVEIQVQGTQQITYDFIKNICSATWISSAGQLSCPSQDGDIQGYVLTVRNPVLESGLIDARTAIMVGPQDIENGYTIGIFPAYTVQQGDRFQTTLSCVSNATECYVVLRLDYQIGFGAIQTISAFLERNEGLSYTADVDLSFLAGQNVKFVLTTFTAGVPTDDAALWITPRIVR